MKNALVIGYVWPEPNSSAAGTRMLQLLEYLLKQSYTVTFATTASPTPFMQELETRKIQTAKIQLNNSSFDNFIVDLNPQLVLFDRFMMEEQFGWRVSKNCPNALRILDTEDLHFLRQHREQSFKANEPNTSLKDSNLAKREIASIYRCDLSFIISETEMQILKEQFGVPFSLLMYLPFLIDEITTEFPAFEERENFISIGNFKHTPNVDMVLYLKKEIWPLIHKQLPKASMLIYGGYSSAQIDQLHNPGENFYIKGRAQCAAKVVKQAKVMLAPLRFGAGLKGKLAEAMQCGTPNITTPIGAEGMNGAMDWSGAITEDATDFAKAAVQFYTQKAQWEQAQTNGYQIINSRFNKSFFYKILDSKIEYLMKNLIKHRRENFIGNMLMHHRSKSTYYMSKFIETKMELEMLKENIKKTTS